LCFKTVLDALVLGAEMDGKEFAEMRDSAIVAIERLATEISNRKQIARTPGLITAVAKATERELKTELSGEGNGQAFLAKPLLMSLLVAL
jgi:hypothetical protein